MESPTHSRFSRISVLLFNCDISLQGLNGKEAVDLSSDFQVSLRKLKALHLQEQELEGRKELEIKKVMEK